MKKIIVDERMRQIEKIKLEEMGYEIIEIKKCDKVYQEISSHVDIFTCKIGKKIVVEPSQYVNMAKMSAIIKGNEEIETQYPYDIKYNVCTIGKKALHNFKYTDTVLKEELIKQGYELINTTQGYTNCSIAVISENSAIVTDKGLYKILKKYNVEVLYLEYEPNIKLLNSGKYSNRKGFIGGAISRIGDKIIVFGDLNKIDINQKIKEFINQKGIQIIDFQGLDVIDYGGIVEISWWIVQIKNFKAS